MLQADLSLEELQAHNDEQATAVFQAMQTNAETFVTVLSQHIARLQEIILDFTAKINAFLALISDKRPLNEESDHEAEVQNNLAKPKLMKPG